MATLKQVAEKAGVSRRTVDRVLNQRGAVKPETAERVRMALEALDYRPDETGKTLAAKKKKIRLAFCSIKGETAVVHEMIRQGAREKAKDLEKLGITVDFYTLDRAEPMTKEEENRLVSSFQYDGMAVVGQLEPMIVRLINKADEQGIPIVFYNIDYESSSKIGYVGCDYYRAGRIAAGLLGMCTDQEGCKVGVFTIGPSKDVFLSPNYKDRMAGFLEEARCSYPRIEVVGEYLLPRDIFDCYEIVQEAIRQQPDMDAAYFVNPGNYAACRAIKKVVKGRRFKIITNDLTTESAALLKEGIITATISQDLQSQGKLSLQILFEFLVLGRKPRQKQHYTELKVVIPQSVQTLS